MRVHAAAAATAAGHTAFARTHTLTSAKEENDGKEAKSVAR